MSDSPTPDPQAPEPSAPPPAEAEASIGGSKDGTGAGDHDQPYTFGRTPTVLAPFPFTTRQFARLLSVRGRLRMRFDSDPSDRTEQP